MTLSAIHNKIPSRSFLRSVVCDIGEIWLCQLFTTERSYTRKFDRCLWYRRDMTLSAIHNYSRSHCRDLAVVCDIGEIWLCQLFTTRRRRWTTSTSCLWYRRDMTLSAIHNCRWARRAAGGVVCDIGEIWLCQLFTTPRGSVGRRSGCLWYRRDMTLSAIHNWEISMGWNVEYRRDMTLSAIHNKPRRRNLARRVVCDIGEIWLCQLFTTLMKEQQDGQRLFVI